MQSFGDRIGCSESYSENGFGFLGTCFFSPEGYSLDVVLGSH